MFLVFIHLDSSRIITCVNCSISFLFENGLTGFLESLGPSVIFKHQEDCLRASCLEYLLNRSKCNHLLTLIFTKQIKDDKKSQWTVNKRNKKCPSEHVHIRTLFKRQRVLTI